MVSYVDMLNFVILLYVSLTDTIMLYLDRMKCRMSIKDQQSSWFHPISIKFFMNWLTQICDFESIFFNNSIKNEQNELWKSFTVVVVSASK